MSCRLQPAALAVLGSVVMHVVQTLCTWQLFALLHVQAEAKRLVTEALRSTDPAIAMLKFQWGRFNARLLASSRALTAQGQLPMLAHLTAPRFAALYEQVRYCHSV